MASKFKNFKVFYDQSRNLERFSRLNYAIQKKRTFYSHDLNDANKSHQNHFNKSNLFKYGAIISAFSAIGLFLYDYRNKLKISPSLFPAVHAFAKTENSLRKRFNFISEVVEKSADAVVVLENPVLFRFDRWNLESVSAGSGFIIKDDGLILTNAHVLGDSQNSQLCVKLKDGRTFPGVIEDIDFAVDLATVRIKAKNLPVMPLGSSADLKAGEWVIAMGSPFLLKDSVSVGIVSSKKRKGKEIGQSDMDYIQTDAAIAMGNSGGPLVNLDGEAVGVNTLSVISGISFAIPIDHVKAFLRRNEEGRKHGVKNVGLKWPNHIGIFMQTLTPEIFFAIKRSTPFVEQFLPEFLVYGVIITGVTPDSPAFKSGLLEGDVLLEVNGERLVGTSNFFKFLQSSNFLNLKVFRGNTVITIVVPKVGL